MAAAFEPLKTFVDRSIAGRGQGMPTEAQAAMMARYLQAIVSVPRVASKTKTRSKGGKDVPSGKGCDETETTGDLEEILCVGDVGGGGATVGELPLACGEEGKERDEAEDGECEGDVGAQGADEEDAGDEHHGDVVEGSAAVEGLAEGGGGGGAVGGGEGVGGVEGVGDLAPMGAVDDEDGEGVAFELGNVSACGIAAKGQSHRRD